MKCFYCQAKTERIISPSISSSNSKCPTCKTLYHFLYRELYSFSFHAIYNEKYYEATFYLAQPTKPVYFVIKSIIDLTAQEVLRLSYLPKNITPFNFQKKLPTLLTFL